VNPEIKLTFDEGYLRVIKPDDVSADYVAGLNDSGVHKYLDTVKHSIQTMQTVQDFISINLASPSSVMFGIWQVNAEHYCGTIRLSEINTVHKIANIGLCIFDKSAWGHGLGSKAIACVTKWAIDDMDLRWIEAGIYEENIASQKAFLSAGYEWIADIPGKYILDGNPAVIKIYANRKV